MEQIYTTYNTMPNLEESFVSAVFGAIFGFVAAIWLFAIIITILTIIAFWKMFEKAGKPGWAAIVPIYNIVVLFQISGMNPWLVLLLFIPVVNFVAAPVLGIVMSFKLAKAFGKDIGWGFGLLFLNTIFILLLGFGKAEYVGEQK